MPSFVQTLHGYDQGHHLLASSQGAELNEHELALLERLSDLSGYIPTGTEFDRYHTGFQCGRYYAFACTWPDAAATRAGTVLTHTLLLPRVDAGSLDDLWVLTPLHRRPHGAGDQDFYRERLSLPELPPVPWEQPPPDDALAAVVLLFGTQDRPLLWVSERRPDSLVRFLWSLLRTEQRERFSFCTFALQPRTVEGRAFDFLGLPPSARGSFLDHAHSEAWWDTGRLLHPRLKSLTQQAWVTEIVRGGANTLRRMEGSCQALGLRLPSAKEFPTLWRFLDLEPAASERLAAARSRADLFERLWPNLEPTHPATDRVLRQLLARQPDAPLEPRPLWELTDFLQRPLVRKRLDTDAEFASQVERVLTREFALRFDRAPIPTLQALPELLGAIRSRWSDSLLDVIRHVLATTPDAAERLAPRLFQAAADMKWRELMEIGLASLSASRRRLAIEESLRPPSPSAPAKDPDEMLPLLEEAAVRLGDFGLCLFLGKLRGHELASLQTIASRLEQTPESLSQVMEPLLAEVTPPIRLSWALGTSKPPRFAWFAAKVGAATARELEFGPDELVQKCSGTPNGARLILLFAEKTYRLDSLVQALRQKPGLALDLIVLALREEGPRIESLTRVAADLIPSEQLLTPELRQALLSTQEQWRARELVRRLGPHWIRALCEDPLAPAELAEWLDIPLLRQWLRYSSRGQLVSATGTTNAHHLVPGIGAALRAWLDSPEAYDRDWIPALLEYLLWNASAKELDPACENLAYVLRRLSTRSLDDHLASKLLALIERTRPASGWHIIELVFARLHARLHEDEKSLFSALASLFTRKDWDRAKQLRQWLVDTYVSCGWPPESFLRSLDGDTALFFRLARRAARTHDGMEFLQRLPSALEAAPELAPHWRRPIEEVLADPHRPVDFE